MDEPSASRVEAHSHRFDDPVNVLLEQVELDDGQLLLSKRRADRIQAQRRVLSQISEGCLVEGKITRRTKGGLLVDIGIEAFLPASQVDIRILLLTVDGRQYNTIQET